MIAGCAMVVAAHSAMACGPWFPNNMLDRGDAAVLVAPVADFYTELDRMPLSPPRFQAVTSTNSFAEETLQAELADLREALHKAGKSSNDVERIVLNHLGQRAKLQKFVDAAARYYPDGSYATETPTPPPFPSVSIAEGLPGEFADYFRGAIVWNNSSVADKTEARQAWQNILNRPDAERHYKSTGAAFMLGRSWENEDPNKAREYYQQVRVLVAEGFPDPTGLAAASLGYEARLALRTNDFGNAINLYLQQYAARGWGSAESLQVTVQRAVDGGPKVLAPLALNPQARRLVTAYLISQKVYTDPRYDDEPASRFHADIKAWLEAVEKADVKDVESAEQFALAAYQADEMELAIRWVNRAGNSPTARWLTAKLLLRAGKVEKATEILSQVVDSFPLEVPTNQPASFGDGLIVEESSAGHHIRGELGALRLSRREYTQALDLLLRGDFSEDAAYVADHVLTTDELRAYVDGNWPAIALSNDEDKTDGQKKLERMTSEIRYLLARRLARQGYLSDARAYYPAEWAPLAEQLMQALTTGWNESLPADERAKALAAAAFMARTNGMELLGTEAGPDWHIYGGDFEGSVTANARTNSDAVAIVASADELKRNAESTTDPDKRFHYRYQAAALAWEAAKLMPNNSDETARLLCTAGSWLKAREPEAADLFYKALVNRCRKTDIGAKADAIRWFPELDAEGNVRRARFELMDLPSAQELGNGEGLASYPTPGKHFLIAEGDRVSDIVAAVERLGFSMTENEIYDANPELNRWEYNTGREIMIPQPAPPPMETTPLLPDGPPIIPGEPIYGVAIKENPTPGYTVEKGDTLAKIAQQFGVTFKSLLDANPELDLSRLKIGQQLSIPGGD